MATEPIPNDFDGFWKSTLAYFLRELMAFVAPDLHEAVDWERGVESLDKELLPPSPDAAHGRRFVDTAVLVHLRSGRDVVLLVHVEVQGAPDSTFSERMFGYWSRLRDKYDKPVFSLAVLADDDPEWRPGAYEVVSLTTRMTFEFPVLKLIDLAPRLDELEASGNPLLVAIAIDLQTRRTRPDEARLYVKTRLLRTIVREERFSPEVKQQLYRLLTWLLRLTDDLEQQFDEDVRRTEARRMEIWSPMELRAIAKGRLEELRENILHVVQERFGPSDESDRDIRTALANLDRMEALRSLFDSALSMTSRTAFVAELSRLTSK
jgi:hypothetical protein